MHDIQEVCRSSAYSVAAAKLANGSLNGGRRKMCGIQKVCRPAAYSFDLRRAITRISERQVDSANISIFPFLLLAHLICAIIRRNCYKTAVQFNKFQGKPFQNGSPNRFNFISTGGFYGRRRQSWLQISFMYAHCIRKPLQEDLRLTIRLSCMQPNIGLLMPAEKISILL